MSVNLHKAPAETDRFDNDTVRDRFEFLGFAYGVAIVRDRLSGVRGTLIFDGRPRVYYGFQSS